MQNVFQTLITRLAKCKNEEEVRIAWVSALEKATGIEFDAEQSKRDLSYNNVIIEFKGPGKFKNKTSVSFIEAMNHRLLPYILKAAHLEKIHESDYIGIAIDNAHLCFAQVIDGEIISQHLLPISPITFNMVIEACNSSKRRAVTADTLIVDFGHSSLRGVQMMQALSDALSEAINSEEHHKIQMLFEEWRTLYGQVADLSKEQLYDIDNTLKFTFDGKEEDRIPACLFVIHTYNSLLIKLLAAEIVAAHGLTSGTAFAQELAVLTDDETLVRRIKEDIEHGRFFDAVGIKGFVEEAIFSWYLDVYTGKGMKKVADAIRNILAQLSLYRTDRLENSRDVLRDFYQNLVPETLRKSLGEFYTPDWLVEYTVDCADVKDWLSVRVLDPTCGSGSFLWEVIQRKRRAAEEKELGPAETLEMLAKTVWGFDLNPLAVQSSRTNFLISVADLLRAVPGTSFEVPVLLADAVYSPARNPSIDENIVEYSIGSQIANLKIVLPAELAFNRILLDGVFQVMGEQVEDNIEFDDCKRILQQRNLLTATTQIEWDSPLRITYDQVLNLHRKNWNGIWFRIVRNFFWSATAGEFDVVIGNPPWVRWSKLPSAYRERVKPMCEGYEIFSSTPYNGGNELDISGMITYTAADKWLKPGGKLVFVITQTHFQSPSSEGFRKFNINSTQRLVPLRIDDLKALKPFPNAANKTAVAVFKKQTGAPKYPVPYRVWNAAKGFTKAIPPHITKSEALARVDIVSKEATPVGGDGSPWAILSKGRFEVIRALSSPCKWVQGRKGITADLNGLYFLSITGQNAANGLVEITTRPDAGKRDIGKPKTFWIEPQNLYPLLKGASDFQACYFNPTHGLFAIVPNLGIRKENYLAAAAEVDANQPNLRKYFQAYKSSLEARSTYSKRMPNAPYYAIYNVGDYTFSPFKVVWAEQSGNFCSAVAGSANVPLIGSRPFVPDHKIFFVDFKEELPAYYLCGLLNSTIVKEFVESHNISIQVGDIFKHMNLAGFEKSNLQHVQLAKLCKEAHMENSFVERNTLIDKIRIIGDNILMQHISAYELLRKTDKK
ncbi:SAM-dependent methyltransferase [Flavipsychrobacter stenotrophus]|uniref:site-specific DNA-methyltransferase (adenine-specific) n=1 Tax=Flavipsychrobacter stenotrophus TaxID=2077091 RepID=A0A2S7SQC0_9BACT|nr:N-6 DNA methylase [Flavipsychrobacter stenotrophus]PQJ08918.1 SAM-dependent methyltransferase [Flavipsychrobacter stenotrophus]